MVICRNERVGTWSQSKNRDELPFGIFQRIVDVTGFRVFMRGTGDVLYPHFVRELAELGTATVIEDPDFDFILRPVDTQRGVNGVFTTDRSSL